MAKRRTREQIDSDKIIKKHLDALGWKIHAQATETSRVAKDTRFADGSINKAGGTLRDSQNFMVKPDTVLTVGQVSYGKENYPKGNNTKKQYSNGKVIITKGMNALLHAVNDHIEDTTNIIIADITDAILKDFKNGYTD
jgi:hypothetical protein